MESKNLNSQYKLAISSPLRLAVALVILCAIRWVFIANGFDYGWDFETGYRVFQGGVYGKDFYTAVGPLSYQLIGTVFRFLGPHWVWIYLIYYICWLFSIFGAYLILGNISEREEDIAFAIMIVAPLSIPHLSALHVYNCLSYPLAVWCGVFGFSYLETGKYKTLMGAGLLAALSLFTKQNIGLGAAFFDCFCYSCNPNFKQTQQMEEYRNRFNQLFGDFCFEWSISILSILKRDWNL